MPHQCLVWICLFQFCLLGCGTRPASFSLNGNHSVAAYHGSLSVSEGRIVDARRRPVSFAGNSLFWSSGWGGCHFYTAEVVRHLREDWQAKLIRAAIGVEAEGGYLEDPEGNLERLMTVVDAAIREGIYVIVDWHSHRAEDHLSEAVEFFQTVARRYGHQPNVLYEIYNEPVDSDWSTVIKPYAEAVITAIRQIDPDNLIIVGTPSWSQDVDVAAADPIDAANIVYAAHFYAGSHGEELREKIRVALERGVAVMISEWGTVNADGDGPVAHESTREWMAFLRRHQLSHVNWSVHNKAEGASLLQPGTPVAPPWPEAHLTESGRLVRSIIQGWRTEVPEAD